MLYNGQCSGVCKIVCRIVCSAVQYRERGGQGEAGLQCGDVGRRGRRGRNSIMGRCLVQFSELEMVLGCK